MQGDWLLLASEQLNRKNLREDQFVSLFGLSSLTIHRIHYVYLLDTHLCNPKYVLWAFHLLKCYEVRRNIYLKFKDASEVFFGCKAWEVIKFLLVEINEILNFQLYFSSFIFIFQVENNFKHQIPPVIAIIMLLNALYQDLRTLIWETFYLLDTKKSILSSMNLLLLSIVGSLADSTADIEIYCLQVQGISKKKWWLGIRKPSYGAYQ